MAVVRAERRVTRFRVDAPRDLLGAGLFIGWSAPRSATAGKSVRHVKYARGFGPFNSAGNRIRFTEGLRRVVRSYCAAGSGPIIMEPRCCPGVPLFGLRCPAWKRSGQVAPSSSPGLVRHGFAVLPNRPVITPSCEKFSTLPEPSGRGWLVARLLRAMPVVRSPDGCFGDAPRASRGVRKDQAPNTLRTITLVKLIAVFVHSDSCSPASSRVAPRAGGVVPVCPSCHN